MTNYPVNENDSRPVGGVTDSMMTEFNASVDDKSERLGLFELIYGTLFNPVRTFRLIADGPPVFYGFLIFLSVVVITSLVNILLPQNLNDMPPELAEIASQIGPSVGIVGAIMSTVFWLIQAGILQVIAELLGGRGRAVGVLTVLALAGIPSVLLVPLKVVSYFLADSFADRFLSIAGPLLVFIWWVFLLVLGIREVHRFSTIRAVAAVVVPLIGIVLILIVTVLSLFAMLAPLLNNIP